MVFKFYSWIFVILAFLIHVLGLVNLFIIVLGILFFLLGCLCVIYTQHGDIEEYLSNSNVKNPLETPRWLGLNLNCDKKPIVLISPNVKVQTESRKHITTARKQQQQNISNSFQAETRKKNFFDAGIEILFKKPNKNTKVLNFESEGNASKKFEEKRWKPFDNIKIYTDRKFKEISEKNHEDVTVQFAEECTKNVYNICVANENDAHLLNEYGSPKCKKKKMISGIRKIDKILHTIIDYILRDFIDTWFCSLSDNREFSDFRVRNSIEDCITNICMRIKNTQWINLITTKMVDDIANHTRLYRLANEAIGCQNSEKFSKGFDRSSPQRKSKRNHHKRNKSDTDLEWYLSSNTGLKNVANSKFYTQSSEQKSSSDNETNLLNAFFSQNVLYKNECTSDKHLEDYLTHLTETLLYFTLSKEDFKCIPLRTFLSIIIANCALKPLLDLISDPDFINLQVAKLFSKETPSVEYFLKALRQSTDIAELRACRQIITQEMSLKHKDPAASAELASLKYTQKIIDLRINFLQKSKDPQIKEENSTKKLPILSLDELLFKELARSYFLDYLSLYNLQKYVIFYLTADEWKCLTTQSLNDLHINKMKCSREDVYKNLRQKAQNIFDEYLIPTSQNYLEVDAGLIQVLLIKLRDTMIPPEAAWFDSICKYVYEKLKNEEIFLNKFYQSSAYKKLLLELEFFSVNNESDVELIPGSSETGSDSNSGDLNFDDETINLRDINDLPQPKPDLLEIIGFKHSRSHSDCTGIVQNDDNDFNLDSKTNTKTDHLSDNDQKNIIVSNLNIPKEKGQERARSAPIGIRYQEGLLEGRKLMAKIINTAILSEGHYAVYAIQIITVEDNQEKSWHIYRRYSKFLELKKILIKKFPAVARIPFPGKKAFQNTQRAVLEHRMLLLNEFMHTITLWAEENENMMTIIRDFLEPDTDDKKIHGGVVTRTIETIVNPFKTGIRTIRNMPDSLVGGFSRILLGKGPLKEPSFLEVNYLEKSSEYPALTSTLHLLDEVFDLQARSQWLRRAIINRLLGAPWVSQAANKKLIQSAKTLIETEKIENLLNTILCSIWPNGRKLNNLIAREENVKLRTRLAARMSLFALLSDDLKHVVGSETTRAGLLNFFSMWQHKKLNLRLALILLNDILTTVYNIDNITKHIRD